MKNTTTNILLNMAGRMIEKSVGNKSSLIARTTVTSSFSQIRSEIISTCGFTILDNVSTTVDSLNSIHVQEAPDVRTNAFPFRFVNVWTSFNFPSDE